MKNSLCRLRSVSLILVLFLCVAGVLAADQEEVRYRIESDAKYQAVMLGFSARRFADMEAKIAAVVDELRSGDLNRLRLMSALSKLGRDQAETALTTMEGWEGAFDGAEESFRLLFCGDTCMYYLGKYEQAADFYERALQKAPPPVAGFILSSLFTVYSANKPVFSLEKMEHYLGELEKMPPNPQAIVCGGILAAAKGDRETALDKIRDYESRLPAGAPLPLLKTFLAPIWGWLGDAEKVVEYLEPGLREEAARFAPVGFAMYLEWQRGFPAYGAIRDDTRFVEMWERLHAYEPKPIDPMTTIPIPGR